MRLVTEDPGRLVHTPGSVRYFVFATGDGKGNEHKVVKGFSKRFIGSSQQIFINPPPLPVKKKTGLDSLVTIRIFVEKFPVKRLIWTCDKEHFRNSRQLVGQSKKSLCRLV